jgi:hypothetical protein
MRVLLFLFILLSSVCPSEAFAAPKKKKKPAPKKPNTVDIVYTGAGSANFLETYTQPGSGLCSIRTVSANEDATSVDWNVSWQKIVPVSGKNTKPKTASFSATNQRTDSDDCGGASFNCASTLGYFEGILPGLLIAKSGKGFIITILAEQQTRGSGTTQAACMQSSIFDNAITEGMKSFNITEQKIKLTPGSKNKTTNIPYTLNKTFDCVDPAKQQAFLSTACTVSINVTGLITVKGKWTAALVR